MEWRDHAACAQLPWEYRKFFFGEGEGIPVYEQHERARMVCYLCPVQMDCLYYWYETDAEYGVWGGLTVSQRKRYLQPQIRQKTQSLDEVFLEVLWTLGLRLVPKIQAVFKGLGEDVPSLPVEESLSSPVLVEIISG
jgi:WhiB family redox-sensing transcriptional regulator